jgi:hypothetical protein
MSFPEPESAVRPERVAAAAYRIDGRRVEMATREESARSLVLVERFRGGGLATAWIELGPREIELTDDDVEEYLDEIGAGPDLRAIWAAQRGRLPWKETYTKQAKTFVALGRSRGDRSWSRPVGLALEIVPLASPLAVSVGRPFTVELLAGGEPAAAAAVGLMVEGGSERVFRTTDARGRATFEPSRAGRALLLAVQLQFRPDAQRWVSEFTTLTLPVAAATQED